MGDSMETITKFIKGKEYQSETFTSSAGGKLIINSIKKHYSKKYFKRGKKAKTEEENKENKDKDVVPIKEEVNEHIDLEEGDEIEEVEVLEELAEEDGEGEYYDENDDGNWSNENENDEYEDEDEDEEYSEEDSYSDLPKLERQQKKDEKRPDYIDGMKVLKYTPTPQLTKEEDVAMQNIMDPNREEPESGDEDYAMGTT